MVKKSVRLNTKWIALVVLAMMAFLGQSFVMAQTPTAEVEIVGTVSALTAKSITVGTQSFDISAAEIKAGVAVGQLVKIHATQNTSGQWVAREVEVSQPIASQTPLPNVTTTLAPVNAFEITGAITAINGTAITVGGHTIDISNAEIKNSLAVSDSVKIHVIVLNGQWIAREVESASIPVTVTVAANCTPAQPAGWVSYTIQAGDTLSSIAFGSNSTLQAVASANCISNPRNLQVGQTIFVAQQPVLVQSNGGRGHDDGAGHDLNDDHGGNNATDDHGNHNGSDDSGNHNGSDDSGSHNGSDDGGNSGHGGSGSGEGSGHG